MSRNVAIAITLIVILATSLLAALIMRILTDRTSWQALLGWVIFFASFYTPLIVQAARTGQLDACTARLVRLLSNR